MPERVVVIHNAAPPCALSGHYFPLTAWNTRVTPQDDVVEKAALKLLPFIYDTLGDPIEVVWNELSESEQAKLRKAARACLEAIRVGGGM